MLRRPVIAKLRLGQASTSERLVITCKGMDCTPRQLVCRHFNVIEPAARRRQTSAGAVWLGSVFSCLGALGIGWNGAGKNK
jgi:hypothetical protein